MCPYIIGQLYHQLPGHQTCICIFLLTHNTCLSFHILSNPCFQLQVQDLWVDFCPIYWRVAPHGPGTHEPKETQYLCPYTILEDNPAGKDNSGRHWPLTVVMKSCYAGTVCGKHCVPWKWVRFLAYGTSVRKCLVHCSPCPGLCPVGGFSLSLVLLGHACNGSRGLRSP